ncbi:MAG: hypothetical protein RMK20_01860 [Verrucomicrobiales bacterium]|nr:hypothetical protein [Verrucomicrobiales bacterium]
MKSRATPLDLKRIKVRPLAERRSLSTLEEILVAPDQPPPPCPPEIAAEIRECARRIAAARARDAAVILMYGAHLVKNGLMAVVNRLVDRGALTHLATNGAGVIHDWELAFLGRTAESVRENVATGTFGAWEETGRNIHLAVLAGATRSEGFGQSVGRFVEEDGVTLPGREALEEALRQQPSHPLAPARAELLRAMVAHKLRAGRHNVKHPWKAHCIAAHAFRRGVPFTVHPGIGYDIITCHPMFRGGALGRAADIDFRLFCGSVDRLDGGVVLSVGSAIMAPQVFEKSLSCVNNLRLQANRPIVREHAMFVVDIQDNGGWDWSRGEPPKDSPAYYLRFCKSFARMGGTMHYVQCDNVVFLHNLLHALNQP